ncbi:MAG: hypothetical protein L0J17_11830 [Brevibacterium sp.]|uniref:hypothetical protein n=1 Tax=Brevibacterium sp. TaxID=1701 RepID=UPI002648DC9D|nr:hypothetical protein [Brevibacterium sp.]MDN5806419.1 hypothetical protein [Brevibacterium sp.]MDN5834632.1 hypothetical protein [Brevibacterium sp.]MDN5876888.1 hypothetical protein [Brevibacterium sp.]MDN5908592.1 hypothetical protein [Brevibacterium sp.]MDN6134221.1 hypothetical protein [Brevibacterium sp.]
MPSFAIIPAAPILLAGVNLAETANIARLRAAIESCLLSKAAWALPVRELPPLAGLGGLGIDRGIDTRDGELLEDEDWVQAVSELAPAHRAACESAHPAIAVAALHAHAAGVRIGPLGSSADLLIPIDLSVAASENAPLAPVPDAVEANDRVVNSLTGDDARTISAASTAAADVHADLDLLAAALDTLNQEPSDYSFRTVFDESVHEVRSLCGAGTY